MAHMKLPVLLAVAPQLQQLLYIQAIRSQSAYVDKTAHTQLAVAPQLMLTLKLKLKLQRFLHIQAIRSQPAHVGKTAHTPTYVTYPDHAVFAVMKRHAVMIKQAITT